MGVFIVNRLCVYVCHVNQPHYLPCTNRFPFGESRETQRLKVLDRSTLSKKNVVT